MPFKQKTVTQQAERLAALYNMVPNLFWTALNMVPAAYYFYRYLPLSWLWMVTPLCLLPYFLPAAWLDVFASLTPAHRYRRWGVHQVSGYVQQGRFINRLVRRRYPAYRVVYNKATIRGTIHASYMFERFHIGLLLVFFVLAGHAFIKQHWRWALVLLLCNFVYNVYPILLQHYVRLRLRRLL